MTQRAIGAIAKKAGNRGADAPADGCRAAPVPAIYGSLVTLFPEERTGDWLRAPNTNSVFGVSSAISTMTGGNLNGLRKVVSYLLGQIYGRW